MRIPALHPEAAQRLLTYAWPGNVRELENVMQRALVLCDADVIRGAHIVFEPPAGADAHPDVAPGTEVEGALAASLARVEQRLIRRALATQGGQSRAAAQLGISPRTLRYKLARLRAAGVAVESALPAGDPLAGDAA
jgi:two-component system response regulator FlrC